MSHPVGQAMNQRPQLLIGGRRGERGSILVLVALSMTMMLGVMALSIDASYMYDKRNRLYAAADAAAKIGASEVLRNSGVSTGSLKNFADQQVALHGFTAAACGATSNTSVCINHPPASGPFAGNAGYVEAIVSEQTSTFFGGLTGFTSLTPGARAVAGISAPSNCMTVVGSPSGVPTSFEIGNTTLTMNGCGIGVGGPPGMADLSGANPNATVTGSPTPSVSVTGSCTGTCGAMGTLTTGAPSPIDPLAGLAPYPNPGGCIAGTAATLNPGCYSSIGPAVTTLTAGNYYVNGIMNIGASLTGNNVMIYLTGAGQLTSANNNSLTLTAPTSGTYAGIAIFQDPSNGNNFAVGNNFNLTVTGAIYMPGANVDINNHIDFGSSTCTLFIARTLNIRNGNGAFSNSGCAGLYGGAGATFLSVSIAE